jgi:hypothetical protein
MTPPPAATEAPMLYIHPETLDKRDAPRGAGWIAYCATRRGVYRFAVPCRAHGATHPILDSSDRVTVGFYADSPAHRALALAQTRLGCAPPPAPHTNDLVEVFLGCAKIREFTAALRVGARAPLGDIASYNQRIGNSTLRIALAEIAMAAALRDSVFDTCEQAEAAFAALRASPQDSLISPRVIDQELDRIAAFLADPLTWTATQLLENASP